MNSWGLDRSDPLITPHGMLDYYRKLLGESVDLSLPDLLVATFQKVVLDHLVERIGGGPTARWPAPAFWPMARGALQGRSIAVARLPMGAPAAAFALELMIAGGVRSILLVGSAGSLQPGLPVGSLTIATGALRHEGTSHHYLPSGENITPSQALIDGLLSAASLRGLPPPAQGLFWTTDALFRECTDTVARLREAGVLAVEMEASALFAVAAHRNVQIALIAAISDRLVGPWQPSFHTMTFRRAILSAADVALKAASLQPTPK